MTLVLEVKFNFNFYIQTVAHVFKTFFRSLKRYAWFSTMQAGATQGSQRCLPKTILNANVTDVQCNDLAVPVLSQIT
jgi:hypothetical protein